MVALDEISGWIFLYFVAWDKSWAIKAHSLWNLTVQRKFDNFMKSRYKKRYMDWKEKKALKELMRH
jgi:hypothetical protein